MSNDKYEATFHGGGTIVEIVRAAKAEALREAGDEVCRMGQPEVANWLHARATEIETKP